MSAVSWSEIKMVQNLIERCLQQYLTQTEIITALKVHANVEPGFTCLVWQKLEEQNPAFFYAYNVRLRLKDQIVAFNYLVDQQLQLELSLGRSVPQLHSPPVVGNLGDAAAGVPPSPVAMSLPAVPPPGAGAEAAAAASAAVPPPPDAEIDTSLFLGS